MRVAGGGQMHGFFCQRAAFQFHSAGQSFHFPRVGRENMSRGRKKNSLGDEAQRIGIQHHRPVGLQKVLQALHGCVVCAHARSCAYGLKTVRWCGKPGVHDGFRESQLQDESVFLWREDGEFPNTASHTALSGQKRTAGYTRLSGNEQGMAHVAFVGFGRPFPIHPNHHGQFHFLPFCRFHVAKIRFFVECE